MKNNSHQTPSYTNEASPEFLRNLDKPVFTEERLVGLCEETLAIIREQEDYCATHPAVGICRLASEGSQTRKGGVIQNTDSPLSFSLEGGREVRGAQTGDLVTYPDGSTAQIITGSGEQYSDLALVGSRLSNGDEIINTLQSCALLVMRKGVSMPEDFLPPVSD